MQNYRSHSQSSPVYTPFCTVFAVGVEPAIDMFPMTSVLSSNQFNKHHLDDGLHFSASFPPAKFKEVARPDADTAVSMTTTRSPIPGFVALAVLLGWYAGFAWLSNRGTTLSIGRLASIVQHPAVLDSHNHPRGTEEPNASAATNNLRSSHYRNESLKKDSNSTSRFDIEGFTSKALQGDELPTPRAPDLTNATTVSTDSTKQRFGGPIGDSSTLPALRLAWIGDSLTRYQMLSLAYYFKLGSWFPDATHPNLVQKGGPGAATWNQFFNASSFLLGQADGLHRCDCFRRDTDVFSNGRPMLERVFENRYFRTSEDAEATGEFYQNHHLWYFNKCGNGSLQGHWTAPDVNAWMPPHAVGYDRLIPAAWSYTSWGQFIEEYLARLVPKPQYLVFNQGMWEDHDLNSTVFDEIRLALHKVGIQGIYKTTTKKLVDNSTDLLPHDALGCQLFPCLDLSWTARLPSSSFWDGRNHFVSSVNTQFNLQLLELLHNLSTQSNRQSETG